MAKDDNKRSSEEIYAAPVANMLELTIGINQITAGDPSVNGYALRNEIILAQKKREILYKNGYTLPVTAQALMAEAERRIQHSRKLGSNIQRANPNTTRPQAVDSHHIVAQQAAAARPARQLLFAVGIGINDADNGCYLPRYRTMVIAKLPNASWHQGIHTAKYHASVLFALQAGEQTKMSVRAVLGSIRSQLIAGIFPY